jgi:D-sedoheptulose 7-phosphate isomerase
VREAIADFRGSPDMKTTTNSRLETVQAHLSAAADVLRLTLERCAPTILAGAELIARSFQSGGKLLLCGNGGSAADCQHLATEFTCRLTGDFIRPALPALALTTDTSFLTAYTNDFDFEGIFARQVEALGKPGDVLLGISTSGGSGNVVQAVETARSLEIKTLVLTGNRGRLRDLADIGICVPSEITAHIQEAHLAIEHIICHLVERTLFSRPS